LSKIPEDKRHNDPVILGCYKNVMPQNVIYAIRTSQMDIVIAQFVVKVKDG
jgi:hypothetical protein